MKWIYFFLTWNWKKYWKKYKNLKKLVTKLKYNENNDSKRKMNTVLNH